MENLFKKSFFACLLAVFLCLGVTNFAKDVSADSLSVRDFIRLLINTGAVAPDKVPTSATTSSNDTAYLTTPITSGMKISLDPASPTASVVLVDKKAVTDAVVLLKGQIVVEGSSDILLTELPITLTGSSSSTKVSAITPRLNLTIAGKHYSELIGDALFTSTTTFNNLGLKLEAGQSYSFTVSADINNVDGVIFKEGDSLTASVATLAGVRGEPQLFYTCSISANITNARALITTDARVTYNADLTISAFGADLYVSNATTTNYQVSTTSAVVMGQHRLESKDKDLRDANDGQYFFIADGDSRDFMFTVVLNTSSTTPENFNLRLSNIGWGLTPDLILPYGGDLQDSAVSISMANN
jgi:hypothetical protein